MPSWGLPAAFSNTGGFLSSEDAEETGQAHAGGQVEGVVPLKQQWGIRPRVTTQPAESGFATIKAILVDLLVEAKALRLLDQGEYFHTFSNLVESSRISMGIPTATYSKLRR